MSENTIPDMVHPLSKHWDQPNRDNILIDNTKALMSGRSLGELHLYSTSIPTGVYEGKMWKSKFQNKWYLRWFEVEDEEKMLPILSREIIIAEAKHE